MAQQVQIVLVSDLHGGPADETVQFGVDGITYEIDLSADEAAALRNVYGPVHGGRTQGRRVCFQAG
jgi:hypothetical protein